MRKMNIKDIAIIIVLLIAGVWLFKKMQAWPSLQNVFSSKPVVIDKTPILVKEIRSIAQLVTVTSYDEVVVDSLVYNGTAAFLDAFRAVAPMAALPSLQRQIVLIGKGKVMAGTNLQKLDSSHINISNDTVYLRLPHAEILEAVINPGDFETFEERGAWTDREVTAVKLKARDKLIARAIQQNILMKADAKAKAIMETFLMNAGFKVVHVSLE